MRRQTVLSKLYVERFGQQCRIRASHSSCCMELPCSSIPLSLKALELASDTLLSCLTSFSLLTSTWGRDLDLSIFFCSAALRLGISPTSIFGFDFMGCTVLAPSSFRAADFPTANCHLDRVHVREGLASVSLQAVGSNVFFPCHIGFFRPRRMKHSREESFVWRETATVLFGDLY